MTRARSQKLDWQLVEAVRAGSNDALGVLIERYQRQIANLIYLSLGNRTDAEDLTQEVFFRLYQSIPRLEQRDSIFPWLYRIAANLCIDESRKRSVRKVLSLDFLLDQGTADRWMEARSATPDEAVVARERQQQVRDAIGSLPATSRIILLLRDYEDLSYNDIAKVLGISLASVKTRLFRARERLAAHVSFREDQR